MSGAVHRDAIRRRALALVWVGVIWNLGEAGVALWSGLEAGSVALLAFGFDSLIELAEKEKQAVVAENVHLKQQL